MKKPICIYVDNSNIYIGAQEVAKSKGEDSFAVRLHFANFLNLITEGNPDFNEIVWGGSIPPESKAVWDVMRKNGVEPELIPRSSTGENDTVDQAIQLRMYRHARKYKDSPGTLILCTGDGAGFNDDKGFLYDVSSLISDGWDIILYSWDNICHKKLRQFAKDNGKYVALDEHYKLITFQQPKAK